MKTMNKAYEAPAIIEDLRLEPEGVLLAASMVVTEDTEVVSTGQEYEEVDLMQTHSWE